VVAVNVTVDLFRHYISRGTSLGFRENGRDQLERIFTDRCDNTGGGSPGDSTGMLSTFLEAELDRACVLYIVVPEKT
jgi:microcystin degradation protein MlrC